MPPSSFGGRRNIEPSLIRRESQVDSRIWGLGPLPLDGGYHYIPVILPSS